MNMLRTCRCDIIIAIVFILSHMAKMASFASADVIFDRGQAPSYFDLKKAYDLVHHKALWNLLRLRAIPAGIIGLLTGLYSVWA